MNRDSALNILVLGCCGVGKTSYINQLANPGSFPHSTQRASKDYKTGGPVHFNLRDNIERQDTHMLKNDPSIDGVIFMYDVNMSGSFTWLWMRYKDYLSEKTSIITLVGNKAEDDWLPTRQISFRHAREIAEQWDTGSFHINTRCRTDILLPLLYLARRIIMVDEMTLKDAPPTASTFPASPPSPLPAHLTPLRPSAYHSSLAVTNTMAPPIFLAQRVRDGRTADGEIRYAN